MKISFEIDRHGEAHDFLRGLSGKLVRKRFPDLVSWKPSHTSLCRVYGRPVALADAVVFPNGMQAEFGLIARHGFGAYAVRALCRLKASLGALSWMTSLGTVSPATVAISRLHADVTFDQATIEAKADGDRRFGQTIQAEPTTLLASRSMLRARGLPTIKSWDAVSRAQVMWAAGNPQVDVLDPRGQLLGREALPLFFDVAGIEIKARQHFSRLTMHGILAAHGVDLKGKIPQLYMDATVLRDLTSQLTMHSKRKFPEGGMFTIGQ